MRGTCGKPLSAECVIVDYPQYKSIDNDLCDSSAGEVLRQLDKAINELQKLTNVSKLEGTSLGIDPRTSSLLSILQVLISQVSKQKQEIATLKSKSSEASILNTPISIDGSCLNLPSCTDGSTYTLGQLLTAMINKSCGGSSSSISFSQPEQY